MVTIPFNELAHPYQHDKRLLDMMAEKVARECMP